MGYSTYLKAFLAWHALKFCTCFRDTVLTASMNMGGISGKVTLTQKAVGQLITVRFNMDQELPTNCSWQISEFWVDLTKEHKCDPANIGNKIDGFHGQITPLQRNNFTIPSYNLTIKNLMGHSFVLLTNHTRACATIQLDYAVYTTLHVKMHHRNITGDIWFRQASLNDETEVVTDLFHYTDYGFEYILWCEIYQGRVDTCRDLDMTARYSPSPFTGCTGQQRCPVAGDEIRLSYIGTQQGQKKTFWKIPKVPLTGVESIKGKLLVYFDNDMRVLACGEIRAVSKTVQAYINRKGVSQSITFEQASPFDPTIVTVRLFNLREMAKVFQVHEHPVPMQVLATDTICSHKSIGEQWDPFGIKSSSGITHDQIAVGNLSGKFGTLAGKESFSDVVTDYNLPLSGIYSIVGRSVVLYTNFEVSPIGWVCANILEEKVTVAIATFRFSGVIGHVMFSQSAENRDSDTWIYGELNYGDGTMIGTVGNKWQIHNNLVVDDEMSNYSRCETTGSVYNPFNNVILDNDYSSKCNQTNPLSCRVGDVFMQTGPISIRNSGFIPAKTLFTAMNVPLSGVASVVGHSLVIYGVNESSKVGVALACANIVTLRPRQTLKNEAISFSQTYRLIDNFATAFLDPRKANVFEGGFYIYKLPIDRYSNDTCRRTINSVYTPYNLFSEEYFNPFNTLVDSRYTLNYTNDQYEMGYLDGKYGIFFMSYVIGEKRDSNLHLSGLNSIIGRSFMMLDYGRYNLTCRSIDEDISVTNGRMIQAIATFASSDYSFEGSIIFTQYVYPDGSMSDTTIHSMLHYTNKAADEDTNGSMDDTTVSMDDTTVSIDDTTVSMDDTTVSMDATTVSMDDTTVSMNDTTVSMNDTTDSMNDTTSSKEQSSYRYVNKTHNHIVYIGSYQAFGDRTASGFKKCESAGQSFNPYNVNVKKGYTECNKVNPLRCTVGDVSGKIGTFEICKTETVATDTNLPLAGKYSVIGRSFVIREKDNGIMPIACANIRPVTAENVTIQFVKRKKESLLEVSDTYAGNLHTDKWNIVVFPTNKETLYGTMEIDVYFMGTNASDLRQRFMDSVPTGYSSLDESNFKSYADKIAVSVKLFPIVFICKRLLV